MAGDGAGTGAGTRVVRLGDFDDDATSRRAPRRAASRVDRTCARGGRAAGSRAQQWRDTSARLAGPPLRGLGTGALAHGLREVAVVVERKKRGIYHATHASKSEDAA